MRVGGPVNPSAALAAGPVDYSRAAAAKLGIFAVQASAAAEWTKNVTLANMRPDLEELTRRVGQLETLLVQAKALVVKDASADNDAFVEVIDQDVVSQLAEVRSLLHHPQGFFYARSYIVEALDRLAGSARAVESDLRGGDAA